MLCGKSVSALSRAGRGLGGGAVAQPLVAWLQQEGGKGRRIPHGGRGLPAEAPLIRASAERVRPGPTSGGISWPVGDDTLPRESRIFCCTDSTRERFLWVA